MRIWKVGTKRMLGISEQRFAVEGYRNVPETIQNQLNQDVEIFGDFLVCPFTRQKAGEMQMVCVEEGKNLKVQKRQPDSNDFANHRGRDRSFADFPRNSIRGKQRVPHAGGRFDPLVQGCICAALIYAEWAGNKRSASHADVRMIDASEECLCQ
jgi:hypothetical protein